MPDPDDQGRPRQIAQTGLQPRIQDAMAQVSWERIPGNLAQLVLSYVAPDTAGPLRQLFQAAGIVPNDSRLAWQLVNKALQSALRTLFDEMGIGEAPPPDPEAPPLPDGFAFPLPDDFRELPQTLPLIAAKQEQLRELASSTDDASSMRALSALAERLPEQFCLSLHTEYCANPERYRDLFDGERAPFAGVKRRIERWQAYRRDWETELIVQLHPDDGKAWDSFTLTCYGYYPSGQDASEKAVIDVWDEIVDWCRRTSGGRDCIRVISGQVGFGRTTLGQCLAARLHRDAQVRVVYVSLSRHTRIDTWRDAVEDEIGSNAHLRDEPRPVDPKHGEFPVLFVLDDIPDGSTEQAIEEVVRGLKNTNRGDVPRTRMILLADNALADRLPPALSGPEVVLEILPLRILDEDKPGFSGDPAVLEGDRRADWWEACVGSALPAVFDHPPLLEISCCPGVLRRIAERYLSGGRRLSEDPEEVIEDLLSSERRSGCTNPLEVAKGFALAFWQAGGLRTADGRVAHSALKLDSSGLLDGVDTAALQTWLTDNPLIRAPRSASDDGSATLGFFHNALAEHLVAQGLYDRLTEISASPGSMAELLDGWHRDFNGDPISIGTARLLRLSLLRRRRAGRGTEIDAMKSTIEPMFAFHLESWAGSNAKQRAWRLAINSSEVLLVALNACARALEVRAVVDWPDPVAFRDWFSCVKGHRRDDDRVLLSSLSWLDLSIGDAEDNLDGCDLSCLDLSHADLSNCNLRKVDLHLADLSACTFSDSELKDVDLSGARMKGTCLAGATISSQSLNGILLQDIDIRGMDADDAVKEQMKRSGISLQDIEAT